MESDESLISRPRWNSCNVVENSFAADDVAFTFAGFKLDTQACELIDSEGNRVDIALKAFELLRFLIRNRHRVVSQEELISAIWGVETMSESTVPTAIRSTGPGNQPSRKAKKKISSRPSQKRAMADPITA